RPVRNAILHFWRRVGTMTPWKFWDYLTEEHANPIQNWYTAQSVEVQAALDETVRTLKVTDDWLQPGIKQFKELRRKHAGLSELRFWAQKRKFRATGLFRPAAREFIF